MPEPDIRSYHLPPTPLIPNSPYPLIHYPNYFAHKEANGTCNPATVHRRFASNGWHTQWIYRYAPTQPSHYHSATHECMAVLSGSATIRFGVADVDTRADDEEDDDDDNIAGRESKEENGNRNENEKEPPGLELRAHAGDVFLIPAGVAHKTFDPHPAGKFALLTPGNGHGIPHPFKNNDNNADNDNDDAAALRETEEEATLARVPLSGFTMLGAYPRGSAWDFSRGGDHVGGDGGGGFEAVWAVPRPGRDPVVGEGREGLGGLWGVG